MKTIISLLLSVLTVLIYGCGSDSVTPPNSGGGEELIFSMDSLAINLMTGTISKDTIIPIIGSENVKLIFDCNTNIDTVTSHGFFRITALDSINTYLDTSNYSISDLNASHSFLLNASNHFSLNLILQISQAFSMPTYLRLKNVRIIKVL
jgi:hypothetical protein